MKLKIKKNKRVLWLSLAFIAIIILGIGYASINSIILEITGKANANVQQDVFITDVEYISDIDANITTSKILNYIGTTMQSTIELSETNPNSEILYKVSVYNNSKNTYPFLAVLYDQENYDNQNIVYEIQDNGFKVYDTIGPKEKKDIYVKFKYKDSILATNNILNSYINFKIADPNMLKQVTSSGNFFDTIDKTKIEEIRFELANVPSNAVQTFDASAKQDKSIMGYVTDENSNNLYEITFSSNEPIFANTNSSYLFYNLTQLTKISFNNFNTSSTTNMSYMFRTCNNLTSLDITNFNTSKVTSMSYMFRGCSNLTSLDVTNIDTSKVTSMYSMFYGCSNLTNLDLTNIDTSKVTNMSYMFYGCSNLTSLDLTDFDTSEVTDMSYMFSSCNNLASLNITNFNTSKVTNMSNMFYNCKNLTSLDITNFNTREVTSMSNMFSYCKQLKSLDLTNFDTSKVISMSNMFSYCKQLKSLDITKFDTSKVTSMSAMFYECNNLTSLDLTNFDTSKVTGMSEMFRNCNNLTSLDTTNFNTNNVTSMLYMFYGCQNLTSLDLTNFDTSKVTNMSAMFYHCFNLRSLDITNFDTSKVTSMSSMFNSCSSLTNLDLTNFDTSKVTNMSQMFSYCNGLRTIYASDKFNVSKVTSHNNMFFTCKNLVGGNGTTYSSSYVNKTYARIDEAGAPGYFTQSFKIENPTHILKVNGEEFYINKNTTYGDLAKAYPSKFSIYNYTDNYWGELNVPMYKSNGSVYAMGTATSYYLTEEEATSNTGYMSYISPTNSSDKIITSDLTATVSPIDIYGENSGHYQKKWIILGRGYPGNSYWATYLTDGTPSEFVNGAAFMATVTPIYEYILTINGEEFYISKDTTYEDLVKSYPTKFETYNYTDNYWGNLNVPIYKSNGNSYAIGTAFSYVLTLEQATNNSGNLDYISPANITDKIISSDLTATKSPTYIYGEDSGYYTKRWIILGAGYPGDSYWAAYMYDGDETMVTGAFSNGAALTATITTNQI